MASQPEPRTPETIIAGASIRSNPDLYSLSQEDARDLLVLLGASPDNADSVLDNAAAAGIQRTSPGRWHVQVDHAGSHRFLVSVHARKAIR
jgi:hypothetical protein